MSPLEVLEESVEEGLADLEVGEGADEVGQHVRAQRPLPPSGKHTKLIIWMDYIEQILSQLNQSTVFVNTFDKSHRSFQSKHNNEPTSEGNHIHCLALPSSSQGAAPARSAAPRCCGGASPGPS